MYLDPKYPNHEYRLKKIIMGSNKYIELGITFYWLILSLKKV